MFEQTLHTWDYNCFDFPEKVMRSFCLSAYVYVCIYIHIEIAKYNQLWFHNNVTMDSNYMGNI